MGSDAIFINRNNNNIFFSNLVFNEVQLVLVGRFTWVVVVSDPVFPNLSIPVNATKSFFPLESVVEEETASVPTRLSSYAKAEVTIIVIKQRREFMCRFLFFQYFLNRTMLLNSSLQLH